MRDILNDLEAGKYLSDADPRQRVRNQAKVALPKRFYAKATAVAGDDGLYQVHLDGRAVRTPMGSVLLLPNEAVANLVAHEFDAQQDHINPVTMPATRLANTAFDGVSAEPEAVLEDILRFSTSDLVCYRAGTPEALVERQAEAWDPIIDWARNSLGARFLLAEGVIHVEQPRETIGAVAVHLRKSAEPFRLAALHLMTSLTGSALIALAVEAGELDLESAWTAAHVDENWNIEQWGEDAEAAARQAARKRNMMAAASLIEALG